MGLSADGDSWAFQSLFNIEIMIPSAPLTDGDWETTLGGSSARAIPLLGSLFPTNTIQTTETRRRVDPNRIGRLHFLVFGP